MSKDLLNLMSSFWKAIVIVRMQNWCRDQHEGPWNAVRSLETHLHTLAVRAVWNRGKRTRLLCKWSRDNWVSTWKKRKRPHIYNCSNMNSRGFIDLNVKSNLLAYCLWKSHFTTSDSFILFGVNWIEEIELNELW